MVERLKHSNWTDKSSDFIISDIIEYDMRRAGLSIIKEDKLLPPEVIAKLDKLPKKECDIKIGKMERSDKTLKDKKNSGFTKYRLLFGEANDLTDEDILSVKKDAIYVKKFCYETHFGEHIEFAEKNIYQAFLLLGRYEIYWNENSIDVKGITDEHLKLHKDYIMKVIWKFIGYLTRYDYDGARKYIVQVMDDYKHRRLSAGYYREFNEYSKFICYLGNEEQPSSLNDVGDSMIQNLVIGYNYLEVFVPLLGLVM